MNENNLIWVVDTGSAFNHQIYTKLFLSEEEAKVYYDKHTGGGYKKIYQTVDIWNFRKKEIARRKAATENDDRTNLKRIREALGLSQSKLAEKSGVGVRMIQHYEQGSKDVNKAEAMRLYQLAKALDCTIEDLLEK